MSAHFRPRDYAPHDPDQGFWHEAPPRLTFVEDTDADVRANLREFNIISALGVIVGLVAVALVWWAQS